MTDGIDQLFQAFSRTNDEKELSRLKLQAEIEKNNAEEIKINLEAEKIKLDTELLKKQANFTLFLSVLSPLIPIASVLTVLATLYIGYLTTSSTYLQASEKRADEKAMREDIKWDLFEKQIQETTKLKDNPTFTSDMQTFMESSQYNSRLKNISTSLLSNIIDFPTFQRIWDIAIVRADSKNIFDIVNIAKSKKRQYDGNTADCNKIEALKETLPQDLQWTYLKLCSPQYTRAQISTVVDKSDLEKLDRLREEGDNINNQVWFLSGVISDYLRVNSNSEAGPLKIDISNIILNGCDLKGVDFSKADMSNSRIQCRLDGASILPNSPSYQLSGSTWWDAKNIDQKLLAYLIEYQYAASPSAVFPASYFISREDYVRKVKNLCSSHAKSCSDEACIIYGTPIGPYPPQCRT